MIVARSSKGQSSIEAAVVTLVLATVVGLFLSSTYLIYTSYWVEHILYESLICQQERNEKFYCVRKAKQKISSILFLNRDYQFRIENRGNISRAIFRLDFRPPFADKKTILLMKELRI